MGTILFSEVNMKEIKLLTRVEGEGKIWIDIENGTIRDVILNIFEPPRFIEAVLRGQDYTVIPHITARICGICPVAYQMSGLQAIEDAFRVNINSQIKELRKLFYYGEWIQSHAIHVFFLHLPDFMGKGSIFEIGRENPELLKSALKIKKAGSLIIEVIGGRVSHPVTPTTGGFTSYPRKEKLQNLLPALEEALEITVSLTERFSRFDFTGAEFPDLHFVSLFKEDEYPILDGDIISNKGLRLNRYEFDSIFLEYQSPHSTAKKAKINGKEPYTVGPVSRFNNNFEKLSMEALNTSRRINLKPPVTDSSKSILVRMVEIIHSLEQSIRLIKNYAPPDNQPVINPRRATGYGISEAPRGILWHRYSFDSDGKITEANIVPPTAQNQDAMELTVKKYLSESIPVTLEDAVNQAEKIVRNFDPCISCATHFLKLDEGLKKFRLNQK